MLEQSNVHINSVTALQISFPIIIEISLILTGLTRFGNGRFPAEQYCATLLRRLRWDFLLC